jgi:universal stress protein E
LRILQSILFATDFLPATQDVARVAVRLASVFESHVSLLHVLEPTLTKPTDLRRRREQATTRLRELVEQLEFDNVVVDEVLTAIGSPADTIVRKAQEIDADLVLIGAGETTRFDRPAGAVAEAVLQHALQPVLAVRPGEPSVSFDRILCPVDHSAVSRRGLQNAIRLARAFQGQVTVLSVVPAASWLPSAVETGTLLGARAEHEQQWREEFERFFQGIDFGNVTWWKEIRKGIPHEQIVAAAQKCRADMIVMGSTGRTGLARMLMGSVTRRVLRRLPCSLLAVKNEDVLEELLERDVRPLNLLAAEGWELFTAGQYAEAAAKFRQVVSQNPFHVVALESLAEAYSKLGRADDAGRYRRRAMALRHEVGASKLPR